MDRKMIDSDIRQNGAGLNPDHNAYSLWQNSRFYDTNKLSPQNYNSNQWVTSKESDKTSEVKKDAKKRRIISRTSLYEDPKHFYERYYPQPVSSGVDWTKHNWTKASELAYEPSTSSKSQFGSIIHYQKKNRIQQKLEDMLKQPVKLSKAESMMQKMGWQGGALGKSGSGIVEPIKPNYNYAIRNRGLGQRNVPQVKKISTIDNNKNIFTTNVLLFILEFVKDDTEAEVLFDSCLWKEERKWIHTIVNDVINADYILESDDVGHMDIVNEIYDYNCFVLATQSEGQVPNRQLCLYKEAPPNMYLITPADLKYEHEQMETDDKPADLKDTKEEEEKIDEDDECDMDVESNPFLRSIRKNLKKDVADKLKHCTIKDESDVYTKIIEYLIEFGPQENYTELRFLGPFDEEEVKYINKFFDDAKKCIEGSFEGVYSDMVGVFKNKCFDVHEDVNGFTVLYRIQNVT